MSVEIGATVGSYRIVRELGVGGMGRVYLAEHTVLGKRAAIKVLLREFSANADIVNRFFNEARASSRLKHAGVIDIYDFGRIEDGSAFIVMEFLDGESLSSMIKRVGRARPELAIDLARQIALALSCAHDNGIVHRDLKPDNVFLVKDSELRSGVRAKVLDFGIAKLAEVDGRAGSSTRTGALIGTPMYMSPEQCRGAGGVDHRTDIYALGCVLFELVMGQTPFVAEGLGELIAAHITQEPASLTGVLPPPYDALVARMLAKDAAHRPQTMREVASQLQDGGVVPPIDAPTPSSARVAVTPIDVNTLNATNGQVIAAPARPSPAMGQRLVVGLAVAIAAGGIALAAYLHAAAKPAENLAQVAKPTPAAQPSVPVVAATAVVPATTPPVAPARVTIIVSSEPAGADVYRAGDGVRVGKTPWTKEYEKSSDEAVFDLRLKGYREARVATKLDRDYGTSAILERAGKASTGRPPVVKPRPGEPRTSKDGVLDPFAE